MLFRNLTLLKVLKTSGIGLGFSELLFAVTPPVGHCIETLISFPILLCFNPFYLTHNKSTQKSIICPPTPLKLQGLAI